MGLKKYRVLLSTTTEEIVVHASSINRDLVTNTLTFYQQKDYVDKIVAQFSLGAVTGYLDLTAIELAVTA
jgi:hypothetical protein